ncbi:hypothetical protein AV530_019197 [Patagioenas fasciata monilis]|uniref:Uncharacterized protein n=1 Tax=Patagioenas fasciata monilis TaxID=372326 RepID=A0A1V4KX59_PATFA|nr:hypothetical protein AV530_019197 [Patagioenas fasciata monilis]
MAENMRLRLPLNSEHESQRADTRLTPGFSGRLARKRSRPNYLPGPCLFAVTRCHRLARFHLAGAAAQPVPGQAGSLVGSPELPSARLLTLMRGLLCQDCLCLNRPHHA